MFTYCLNSPINHIDISGLLPVSISIIQRVSGDGTVEKATQPPQGGSSPQNTPPDHPDYVPPKKGPQKKKNPNGKGWGWEDKNGDVWVWTPKMHGGEGWTVQKPGGGHSHAYPGGGVRDHCESILDYDNYFLDVFPSASPHLFAQPLATEALIGGGALGLAVLFDLSRRTLS